MTTLNARSKIVVMSAFLAMWAGLVYACNTEDENPATSRTRGTEAGAEGAVGSNDPDGAPQGAPICGKYGGYDKVKTITAALIARVSTDCRIGTPIADLQGQSATHFAECLQIQVGGAFQCPGISYVAGTTKDSNGRTCRSMAQAHQGMNLRKADFDAFLQDIVAEFSAQGITQEDIKAVLPVFEGARTSVVQTNNQPNANTYCACTTTGDGGCVAPIVDAGNDTGNDAGTDAPADAPADG